MFIKNNINPFFLNTNNQKNSLKTTSYNLNAKHDCFQLSFKGEFQDKFFCDFEKFLDDPENADLSRIKSFIHTKTGQHYKPVLNSSDVIDKILKDNYTSNDKGFRKEIESIVDKAIQNDIPLTHGNNSSKLIKKIGEIGHKYKSLTKQKNKPDNFGRIYETIAANEVKRILIPQIAEKIALKEGCSKEEIIPQLRQLNSARLSGSAEFDHLVVRVKDEPTINEDGSKTYNDVEVVGIVETKYSPTLVTHGYERRLEDIAWLTIHPDGYRADKYHGIFDGKMVFDEENNTSYNFTPKSFKNIKFGEDNKESYESFYFVTSNTPLVEVNEKLVEQITKSGNIDDLKSISIKNEFTEQEKAAYKKYKEFGLSNNIIFTNDDFCGFSLLSFILFHRVKNICVENKLSFIDYEKIGSDLLDKLKSYCKPNEAALS